MSFAIWFRQCLAFIIAWTVLLFAPLLVDQVIHALIHLVLLGWVCIGLGVMLTKGIDLPKMKADRVDVAGAVRILWWAVHWPRHLISK